MWKLIFIGIVVWLVVYIVKRNLNQSKLAKPTSDEIKAEESKTENKIEDMVQCAACAVHLPRSEAFLVAGSFYCSKAHISRK